MIEWKDASSYSRGQADRVPSVWKTMLDGIEVSVHKYKGCGDEWFVTSRDIGLNMVDLDTEDSDHAKGRALAMVFAKLEGLISKYERIRDIIREN